VSVTQTRRGWSPLVPLVAALAGLLFATSAITSHGTDLRASRSVQLAELVRAQQQEVAALAGREQRLSAGVARLTALAAMTDAGVRVLQQESSRWGPAVGLSRAVGPGVTVVLNDAPRLPPGRTLPGNPTPDDLVVHQQDVQAVENALWSGGARAVAVMGQRLIATTAVQCVGNTLLLYGGVYSPPYVISAVGPPANLVGALDAAPDVQIYRQYVAAFGLGYRVTTTRRMVLPAYQGPVQLSGVTANP
jgi:uncharacterized protein YlxW (UPF0749 family)